MKRVVAVLVLVFLLFPGLAFAEVISVTIKGVDDGVKTSKQQDYNEALMNAKIQAIERAGVEIESITKIVNFQLKFQTVESKAKAVLMPGFDVVDIGYVGDGTYQVVLVGKVVVGDTNVQELENAKIRLEVERLRREHIRSKEEEERQKSDALKDKQLKIQEEHEQHEREAKREAAKLEYQRRQTEKARCNEFNEKKAEPYKSCMDVCYWSDRSHTDRQWYGCLSACSKYASSEGQGAKFDEFEGICRMP